MAVKEIPIFVDTIENVTADLSGSQYLALTEAGALCGAGDNPAGILQNNPNGTLSGGASASIMRLGVSRAIASAAIAKGDKVATAAGGKMRTAASGDDVIGSATEAAAANNDVMSVFLTMGGAPLP